MTGRSSTWSRRNFTLSFRRSTAWEMSIIRLKISIERESKKSNTILAASSTRSPWDKPSMSTSKTIQKDSSERTLLRRSLTSRERKSSMIKILRKKNRITTLRSKISMLTLSLSNQQISKLKVKSLPRPTSLRDPFLRMRTTSSTSHPQVNPPEKNQLTRTTARSFHLVHQRRFRKRESPWVRKSSKNKWTVFQLRSLLIMPRVTVRKAPRSMFGHWSTKLDLTLTTMRRRLFMRWLEIRKRK